MVTSKQQILDIAMNLTRIGNWAADGFDGKQKRITLFLDQTQQYVTSLSDHTFTPKFQPTLQSFLATFPSLYVQGAEKPTNTDIWAEQMMTWGNILTHRASLLD